HRRRPQVVRTPDRRDGRAHDLREHAPAPGPRGSAPGARREPRALAQHRRPADHVRDRDPRPIILRRNAPLGVTFVDGASIKEDTMPVANPPENMPRISPYLYYEDVAGALAWLSRAFGLR